MYQADEQRPGGRRTQAQRRAATREALLAAAARGLSRHGYGDLKLEQVARDAGCTRGALYHQFSGKEELALAVVDWVRETWEEEVGALVEDAGDPVGALVAVARGHARYCRRDVARVMMVLRIEFGRRDGPIGAAIATVVADLIERTAVLVAAGRATGAIPPGPNPTTLAGAYLGAIEGLNIQLAGAPDAELLAERTVLGLLGLPPSAATGGRPRRSGSDG